jgi:hypothetical protein
MADRVFSEQLHRIRDVHIDVESILQSLAALQDDKPCASCTSVCCKEVMCRESMDSDFLRFLLGPLVDRYSVDAGWYVLGSGCRLSYGRPLVCYEFFCEKFEAQDWTRPRQLSRALKTLYANAFAGQHMLMVETSAELPQEAEHHSCPAGKIKGDGERGAATILSEKLGMRSRKSKGQARIDSIVGRPLEVRFDFCK